VLSQDSNAVTGITSAAASAIRDRQPLRYAGYAYDAHSATDYLSARHYAPATMRFLTKDPARDDGEESAYQYCAGDPVGRVDPTGEVAQLVVAGPVVVLSAPALWALAQRAGPYAAALAVAVAGYLGGKTLTFKETATTWDHIRDFGIPVSVGRSTLRKPNVDELWLSVRMRRLLYVSTVPGYPGRFMTIVKLGTIKPTLGVMTVWNSFPPTMVTEKYYRNTLKNYHYMFQLKPRFRIVWANR
jgi:RHS repeat-associated protein